MAITFHTNDCTYPLKHKGEIRKWISRVACIEGARVGEVNIVLCSDDALLEVNKTYLNHNYYTDIITFDYSEMNHQRQTIAGDLMISVDTVRSNAQEFNQPMERELLRVIIHGILHLLGQGDKTPSEATQMRKREDQCLRELEKMQDQQSMQKLPTEPRPEPKQALELDPKLARTEVSCAK